MTTYDTFHSALKVVPDEWNHVCVRVNKTGVTFDVNNQRASIVDDITFVGSSNNFFIANSQGWNSNTNFIGSLDDVTIYDKRVQDITLDKYLSSFPIIDINPSTLTDESPYNGKLNIGETITRTHLNNKFVFNGETNSTISVNHDEYDRVKLHHGWTLTTFVDPTTQGLVEGPLFEKDLETAGSKIRVEVNSDGKLVVTL